MSEKSTSLQQNSPPLSKQIIYGADEVRTAIANGKLLNYYQPKVNIDTREVVGVETLVRWLHPQNGMVPPDKFIVVAEKNDLIDDLTRVVLTNALDQAKSWHDSGLNMNLSLNLSVNNFHTPDFVTMIVDSSVRAGIPPQMVELEVTESVLNQELKMLHEAISRLSQKQFRVSINDFDVENSSLIKLMDLPVDEVKIKPSIVHGARNNKHLRAKIETTVAQAKQLGISIVAVGVEDSEDWNFIRTAGCNISQGGYISPPMPGPDFPGWIRSWHSTD